MAIFITGSIILLIITIVAYLIYLNRNKIALILAPYFYYKCNGQMPKDKKSQNLINNLVILDRSLRVQLDKDFTITN